MVKRALQSQDRASQDFSSIEHWRGSVVAKYRKADILIRVQTARYNEL